MTLLFPVLHTVPRGCLTGRSLTTESQPLSAGSYSSLDVTRKLRRPRANESRRVSIQIPSRRRAVLLKSTGTVQLLLLCIHATKLAKCQREFDWGLCCHPWLTSNSAFSHEGVARGKPENQWERAACASGSHQQRGSSPFTLPEVWSYRSWKQIMLKECLLILGGRGMCWAGA